MSEPARAPKRGRLAPGLLTLGLPERLALAGLLAALVWLAIAWAMS